MLCCGYMWWTFVNLFLIWVSHSLAVRVSGKTWLDSERYIFSSFYCFVIGLNTLRVCKLCVRVGVCVCIYVHLYCCRHTPTLAIFCTPPQAPNWRCWPLEPSTTASHISGSVLYPSLAFCVVWTVNGFPWWGVMFGLQRNACLWTQSWLWDIPIKSNWPVSLEN